MWLWLWVKVLHPTRHKIAHFRDVLSSQFRKQMFIRNTKILLYYKKNYLFSFYLIVTIIRLPHSTIATDRVAWSVGLTVCNKREPCKSGWTNCDTIWELTWVGPRNHLLDRVQMPHARGTFEGDGIGIFPQAVKCHSRWPWLRDFPTCCWPAFWLVDHRSSPVMRPLIRIHWSLVIIMSLL